MKISFFELPQKAVRRNQISDLSVVELRRDIAAVARQAPVSRLPSRHFFKSTMITLRRRSTPHLIRGSVHVPANAPTISYYHEDSLTRRSDYPQQRKQSDLLNRH
jgi:hypothetical protein